MLCWKSRISIRKSFQNSKSICKDFFCAVFCKNSSFSAGVIELYLNFVIIIKKAGIYKKLKLAIGSKLLNGGKDNGNYRSKWWGKQ